MMGPRRDQGMSLIELMVSIAIISLLVVLGTPTYSTWIANTKIRSAAETIQNGLRLARTEAVQAGAPARFEISSAATDWTVCVPAAATPNTCASAQRTIQAHVAADGTTSVRVGGSTTPGVALATDVSSTSASGKGVTFSALGRVVGTTPLVKVDAASAVAGTRRLVTAISPGGSVFMCDPVLDPSVSPQGCPLP